MKLRTLPKSILVTIVLVLSLFLVAGPTAAYASTSLGSKQEQQEQQDDERPPRDACSDAESQAVSDTNGTIWFLGGCLAGVLTLILAQVLDPEPPASVLLGKPPEYVAQYTDCYTRAAKKRRTNRALTGCLTGVAVYAALYGVLFLAAASESSDF